jgi:lipoprotein-anchoring transpeptidase ErfK/SrfK
MGAKLLFGAALVAVAFQVTGLPLRAPAVATARPERASPVPKQTIAAPIAAPADEGFVVKRILDIDGPLNHGDYVWDDKDVPAGPIVITIDLAAQTLSVFRAGYEIGTAVILYGAGDKPTPLGVFSITEKDAHHVSNLYDAPMPYMMRLTNDGVTIHGSDVEWGAATHGCIGVPTKFAALLFAQATLGDSVIITDGKMLSLGEPLPAA